MLPDIVKKCFCTPDEATDPTFSIFVRGMYYSNNLGDIFLGHPVEVVRLVRLAMLVRVG